MSGSDFYGSDFRVLKESACYGKLSQMQNAMRCRTVFTVLAVLLVGGLVASAMENEGPSHQDAVHHCAICCTHLHAALTPTQESPRLVASEDNGHLIGQSLFYQQIVVRLLFRPPKHLV